MASWDWVRFFSRESCSVTNRKEEGEGAASAGPVRQREKGWGPAVSCRKEGGEGVCAPGLIGPPASGLGAGKGGQEGEGGGWASVGSKGLSPFLFFFYFLFQFYFPKEFLSENN